MEMDHKHKNVNHVSVSLHMNKKFAI